MIGIRRWERGLIAAAAVAFTTAAAAQTAPGPAPSGTLKKVQDSGTLTIGFRENAMPFSFLGPDGKPRGYSIDLCQEIAQAVQQELKLANLAVKWVPVTADTRVDAVASGAVDLECGTTSASLSRQEKVDFTLLTFVDGTGLLIPEGSGIANSKDLAGKKIGVVSGTTTEKVLGDYLRQESIPATLVTVKDHDDGLAALQLGQVDVYSSDRVILVGLALQAAQGTNSKRYSLVADALSYEPYALMVRRDDSAFRLVANRTLARLYRSGAVGTLYAKWFGPLGKPTPAILLMYAIQGLPE
jgi:glutamate/aspartate transport system substrate-binding protein